MQILGILIIFVGVALIIAGKGFDRYMPPDYDGEDREDVENALRHTGRILMVIGAAFAVAGIAVCVMAAYM